MIRCHAGAILRASIKCLPAPPGAGRASVPVATLTRSHSLALSDQGRPSGGGGWGAPSLHPPTPPLPPLPSILTLLPLTPPPLHCPGHYLTNAPSCCLHLVTMARQQLTHSQSTLARTAGTRACCLEVTVACGHARWRSSTLPAHTQLTHSQSANRFPPVMAKKQIACSRCTIT